MYCGEPRKGGCELNLRPCNRSVREGRSRLLEGATAAKGEKGMATSPRRNGAGQTRVGNCSDRK